MNLLPSLIALLLTMFGTSYEYRCEVGKVTQFYEDGTIEISSGGRSSVVCDYSNSDLGFYWVQITRVYGNTYKVTSTQFMYGPDAQFPEDIITITTTRESPLEISEAIDRLGAASSEFATLREALRD